MAVSIKNVAERAGVSPSTVSKVLNGAPDFSVQTATRLRIEQAVAELGYVPNAGAQSLGRKRAEETGVAVHPGHRPVADFPARREGRISSGTVGCVLSHSGPHHWDMEVLGGIEKQLSELGVTLATSPWLYASAESQPSPAEQVNSLLSGGCGAVIVIALTEDPEFAAALISAVADTESPVVFVTGVGIPEPVSHVCYSGFDAGYKAAKHLRAQGWNKLGFAGAAGFKWSLDRHAGVLAAVNGRGETGRVELHQVPAFDPANGNLPFQEAGRVAGRRLFAVPGAVNAIVAANDFMAAGVIEAGAEIGLKPGVDFGIVGFDNNPVARSFGITTLQPPMAEMAREAALHCVDRLANGSAPRALRLQSDLIVRASTTSPV